MSMMGLKGAGHRVDGTFQHLGKLPRLPLPSLADSLVRFDDWCAPLLDGESLDLTRQAISRFGRAGGTGEKLQSLLEHYDQQDEVYSWLDDFWPARYLGRRVPVSVNANFCFLFKKREGSQVRVAAELIAASLDIHQRLANETLPVASSRGRPLCTAEYKYLFSSSRIPGGVLDHLRAPYSDESPGCSTANHIVVFYQCRAHRLQVVDQDGKPFRLEEIETGLREILAEALPEPDHPVGYLTTLPRSDWAQVRPEFLALGENGQSTEEIEQALFCVCLEDEKPEDIQTATDLLLMGNGGNRWFDKSLSLIIFSNGAAGLNSEHCGLDGTAVAEFVDALHDSAMMERVMGETAGDRCPASTELRFTLNSELRATVDRARNGFDALVGNTATRCFAFTDFGTDYIKSLKVSPDAFVQMAFQWAHFKTKGLAGTTYESVSTRHFERGRTEAMRVVTEASQAFVVCMNNPESSRLEQVSALRAAAAAHVARAKDCQAGLAPEQHLWRLQMVAEQQAESLDLNPADLALFESPGWLTLRDDYLSTSSVPSENIAMFAFGATNERCIGIAYLPRRENISGFFSTPQAVADQMHTFSHELHQAFHELADLLKEATL